MRLHSKLITPVNILSIFSSKCHENNIVTRPLTRFYHQNVSQIGIADNHGNTKIMETVIFVNCHDAFAHFSNCHECCGFAKMPYFCHVFFCQNTAGLRFHKNILFLISITWSSTQNYSPFPCLWYQSPCALLLTGGICDRDIIVVCTVCFKKSSPFLFSL